MRKPRQYLTVIVVWLAVGLLSIPGIVGPSSPQQMNETAYFKFDYPPYADTFIIQMTDPVLISKAREMLAGKIPMEHVSGQIVKYPAAYNHPWSFQLDSATIQFFRNAIEVCDAQIASVEQNLEAVCGAFLPGCTWCPWGSGLIEEVQSPAIEIPRLYLPRLAR